MQMDHHPHLFSPSRLLTRIKIVCLLVSDVDTGKNFVGNVAAVFRELVVSVAVIVCQGGQQPVIGGLERVEIVVTRHVSRSVRLKKNYISFECSAFPNLFSSKDTKHIQRNSLHMGGTTTLVDV